MPSLIMESPIDPLLTNFFRNNWDWSLWDFCKAVGLDPDAYGQEKFQQFRAAANALGQFDKKMTRILFADHRPVPMAGVDQRD